MTNTWPPEQVNEAALKRSEVDLIEPGLSGDLDSPCHCFCSVVHPAAKGICQGMLAEPGYRVHFVSPYATEDGVRMCRPCADSLRPVDA